MRAFDPSAEVPAALRTDSVAAAVRGASHVVIATPVAAVADAARAVKPHVDAGGLVLDVSSVKAGPVAALAEVFGREVAWVATHPLFGPTSIALGERPLVTVVCPNPLHPDAAARARRFYEAAGCEVVEQDAAEHDRVMAHTHALAFFVAKALMDIGAGEGAAFVPPSFRAIARTIDAVRSDASHLFATIQNDNPYSADARTQLMDALRAIHGDLANAPTAGATAVASPRLAIPDLGTRAPDLRETRDLIDDLDREIVQLLARRAALSRRAGRAKAQEGRPVFDGERERQVFEARGRWARAEGLDPTGVTEIFESIVRFSRAIQKGPDA